MNKQNVKNIIASVISIIILAAIGVWRSTYESVDMIMPSVYILDGMTLWYVIFGGVIAEACFVKLFLKESYLKSITISLVMNVVTILLGFITLHLVSLLIELLLIFAPLPSFHIVYWLANFLLIILMNASLEGLTVKIFFKKKFKKMFGWLCLANLASLLICFLCNLSWLSSFYFNTVTY